MGLKQVLLRIFPRILGQEAHHIQRLRVTALHRQQGLHQLVGMKRHAMGPPSSHADGIRSSTPSLTATAPSSLRQLPGPEDHLVLEAPGL